MDESRKYYAAPNKPDIKEYIMNESSFYDILEKINLISNENK